MDSLQVPSESISTSTLDKASQSSFNLGDGGYYASDPPSAPNEPPPLNPLAALPPFGTTIQYTIQAPASPMYSGSVLQNLKSNKGNPSGQQLGVAQAGEWSAVLLFDPNESYWYVQVKSTVEGWLTIMVPWSGIKLGFADSDEGTQVAGTLQFRVQPYPGFGAPITMNQAILKVGAVQIGIPFVATP
jgi:hypothetical protein